VYARWRCVSRVHFRNDIVVEGARGQFIEREVRGYELSSFLVKRRVTASPMDANTLRGSRDPASPSHF